jgi:hypothetical protein
MKKLPIIFIAAFLVFLGVSVAWAECVIEGYVYCDADKDGTYSDGDKPLPDVDILIDGAYGATTDSEGWYSISSHALCDVEVISLDVATLPFADYVFIEPSTNGVPNTAVYPITEQQDWAIYSDTCVPKEECWLTAGGVKFDNVLKDSVATSGPRDSVGGVAYPGCSAFASGGGQWNHVAHGLKLHLIGKDITVLQCGNVPGIDPGSESPVCTVNFIEFEGTGIVKGIHGNKIEDTPVTFFVRAEDRNEPGNAHASAGEDIDRYFLRVVDGGGNILILVDEDDNSATVDPLTITGGNFQIHCTSCD